MAPKSTRATATWMHLWVSTPRMTQPRLRSRFILVITTMQQVVALASRVDGIVMGPYEVRLLCGHYPSGQHHVVRPPDGRQINSQDTRPLGESNGNSRTIAVSSGVGIEPRI
jgi:hypothetical protein